jgi:hypothetical protein
MDDRPTQAQPTGAVDGSRAVAILTAEHSSLNASRALVYNESFARTGMFLTFLSASIVALALVGQGISFDRQFLLVAAIILGFDVFIGLVTLGRVSAAAGEDLRCIAGMNRIRHAYLEMEPSLGSYFITSTNDDLTGVLTTYGQPVGDRPSLVRDLIHGLTTADGMVAFITVVLGGMLAGVVALLIGADSNAAVGIGLGTFTGLFLVMAGALYRRAVRFGERLGARFPSPPSDLARPGGRTPGA